MSLKFGTSGVRALVSDLTDRNVYVMTTAFLKYAISNDPDFKNVYTGMDLRESSPKLLSVVHAAIIDAGKSVFFCGAVPTPCLANFSSLHGSPSIMLTGSHIPADRNGIKFYLTSGETLKEDDSKILEIFNQLLATNYSGEKFDDKGCFRIQPKFQIENSEMACSQSFENRYLNFFSADSLKGQKVVFYEHSSVARSTFPEILKKLGANVICVGRSETFVAVDTEAVDSVDKFQGWIKSYGANALVSTDGDADRPLVIDNTGAVVPGDTLGMISCQYLNIEAVALPISCNSSINKIENLREIRFTKIGSPFVVKELNELAEKYKRVAGFEANGGFILKSSLEKLNKLPTRDSMLPILCALVKSNESGKSLSQLASEVNKRSTASVLVRNCPPAISQKLLEKISNNPELVFNSVIMQSTPVQDINKLDGIRISNSEYAIHFRPSGNADEFRCYTEAATTALAQEIAERAKKYVSEYVQNSV